MSNLSQNEPLPSGAKNDLKGMHCFLLNLKLKDPADGSIMAKEVYCGKDPVGQWKSDVTLDKSLEIASDSSYSEESSFLQNSVSESRDVSNIDDDRLKRGRPRADQIQALRDQGARRPSAIHCTECFRVFPRDKSLKTHLLTHTGKRALIFKYPTTQKFKWRQSLFFPLIARSRL